jgi:hypothetical protein
MTRRSLIASALLASQVQAANQDPEIAGVELFDLPSGGRCGFTLPIIPNAPTLVILAMHIMSPSFVSYPEAARILKLQGWNIASTDNIGHGPDLNEMRSAYGLDVPRYLDGWRCVLERGGASGLLSRFITRCSETVDFGVNSGLIDPNRVAVQGNSRGAWAGTHWAASDTRVKAIAAINPVTELMRLSEFSTCACVDLADSLDLFNLGNLNRSMFAASYVTDNRVSEAAFNTWASHRFSNEPDVNVYRHPGAGHGLPIQAQQAAASFFLARV